VGCSSAPAPGTIACTAAISAAAGIATIADMTTGAMRGRAANPTVATVAARASIGAVSTSTAILTGITCCAVDAGAAWASVSPRATVAAVAGVTRGGSAEAASATVAAGSAGLTHGAIATGSARSRRSASVRARRPGHAVAAGTTVTAVTQRPTVAAGTAVTARSAGNRWIGSASAITAVAAAGRRGPGSSVDRGATAADFATVTAGAAVIVPGSTGAAIGTVAGNTARSAVAGSRASKTTVSAIAAVSAVAARDAADPARARAASTAITNPTAIATIATTAAGCPGHGRMEAVAPATAIA
jgi:trimeric autotransporter adhesin